MDGSANEPWQLGIAVVENGVIRETREWFFGTSMTPDFETMQDQWESFAPYFQDTNLVAHNIATERTILTRTAPLTKWGPWFDTLKLARARYKALPSYKLGDLCEMFSLCPKDESRTWHDALYDAVACANLAIFLGL